MTATSKTAMRRALMILCTALALASCARHDALDRALRRDVGTSAVDCGRVNRKARDKSNEERADRCVADAFAKHQAFRVRYDDQGRRSPFKSAKAMTPAGVVYFYSYDGRKDRVTRFTCTRPQLQAHGDHQHLICMACLECTATPSD